jgi:uncharacterized LabA/DUF88 family protein
MNSIFHNNDNDLIKECIQYHILKIILLSEQLNIRYLTYLEIRYCKDFRNLDIHIHLSELYNNPSEGYELGIVKDIHKFPVNENLISREIATRINYYTLWDDNNDEGEPIITFDSIYTC